MGKDDILIVPVSISGQVLYLRVCVRELSMGKAFSIEREWSSFR